MRALLDEQIPRGLARNLPGHQVDTVGRRGWSGVKNGALLRLMQGEFDALITMDRGIEHQQNLSGLTFGIVLVHARQIG